MSKIKIEFEREGYKNEGGWNWHYGTARIKEKEHQFTLLEMAVIVGDENVGSTYEITWVDETPENSGMIEKEVMKAFSEQGEEV